MPGLTSLCPVVLEQTIGMLGRLRKARECAQARAAQTFLERRQQQVKAEEDSPSPNKGPPAASSHPEGSEAPVMAASAAQLPSNGDILQPAAAGSDGDAGSPAGIQQKPEEQIAETEAEEAERVHAQFMTMLLQAIEQTLDTSQFEDSCRALLGTSSHLPSGVC